jgi:hypothetical protein
MRLLNTANTKTMKGEEYGYLTFIQHLAPSWLSGFNTCAMASEGCAFACLNTSGMGKFSNVQAARISKTKFFFEAREVFMAQLVKEVTAAVRKAEKIGMTPAIRLNGTSDLRWETVEVAGKANVMEVFPDVQFYDYTKIPNRRDIPKNYHLTFSRSETNDFLLDSAFERGMNVAVVFDRLPETFLGRKVIDGTLTDLRFLDEQGVVVGLEAKGKAKTDQSGFVVLTGDRA